MATKTKPTFSLYSDIRALITANTKALNRIAKAIESYGFNQATLKKVSAGLKANTKGIKDAQKR